MNGGGGNGTIALIQPHSLRVLVVHLTRQCLELSALEGQVPSQTTEVSPAWPQKGELPGGQTS